MRKQFILFGTVSSTLLVLLGGCSEQNDNITGDNKKVELVDYSVETQKHISIDQGDWVNISDGFLPSEEAERYFVSGTIKNIAGYMLMEITITADFFDSSNQLLHSESTSISELSNMNTSFFEISYWDTSPFFQDVDHMKFNITAS